MEWSLITSAELATAELAKRLSIPRHSAVLRQLRVTALPDGRVVEVLDQRVSGDRYEVHHPLPRARSAAWPVTPATAPTPPTTSDHDTPGDMSPDAGDTGQAP